VNDQVIPSRSRHPGNFTARWSQYPDALFAKAHKVCFVPWVPSRQWSETFTGNEPLSPTFLHRSRDLPATVWYITCLFDGCAVL